MAQCYSECLARDQKCRRELYTGLRQESELESGTGTPWAKGVTRTRRAGCWVQAPKGRRRAARLIIDGYEIGLNASGHSDNMINSSMNASLMQRMRFGIPATGLGGRATPRERRLAYDLDHEGVILKPGVNEARLGLRAEAQGIVDD